MNQSKPSVVAEWITLLGDDLRETFEERAAIREFEGCFPRDLAEALALLDLCRAHPLCLSGLSLRKAGRSRYLLSWNHDIHASQAIDLAAVLDEFGGSVQLTPSNN